MQYERKQLEFLLFECCSDSPQISWDASSLQTEKTLYHQPGVVSNQLCCSSFSSALRRRCQKAIPLCLDQEVHLWRRWQLINKLHLLCSAGEGAATDQLCLSEAWSRKRWVCWSLWTFLGVLAYFQRCWWKLNCSPLEVKLQNITIRARTRETSIRAHVAPPQNALLRTHFHPWLERVAASLRSYLWETSGDLFWPFKQTHQRRLHESCTHFTPLPLVFARGVGGWGVGGDAGGVMTVQLLASEATFPPCSNPLFPSVYCRALIRRRFFIPWICSE